MRLVARALRGEGRVGRGDIDRVRRGRAEHALSVGILHTRRVFRVPGPRGNLVGGLRSHILIELEIGRVHRIGGGSDEVSPFELGVAEVDVLLALDRHGRGPRIAVGQGGAILQSGYERERLEGRAGLGHGPRGRVQASGEVVAPPIESEDATGLRVDRHQPDSQIGRVPLRQALNCGDGRVLVGLVDRGDDRQTAGVDLLIGEPRRRREFLADHLEEIAVGALVGLVVGDVDRGGEGRGIVLGLGDVAVIAHEAEHAVPADVGLVLVDRGVPGAGRGKDPSQKGGLGVGHLGRRVTEIGLAGGLDAVGGSAEVHRVEIGAEDLRLGLRSVDLEGHDGLLELARVGTGRIDVVVLDVLLGEGGGSLGPPATGVVDEGPQDSLRVHTAIGVEAPILGGHDGVAHMGR